MAQALSYTIISQGDDSAILSFVDMSTGKSGNIPNWAQVEDDTKEAIMDIINNPDSVSGDAITAIYSELSDARAEKILDMRDALGITVSTRGDIIIGDTVLPHAFQELLANVSTEEDARSIVAFAHDVVNNPGEHCQEALIEWLVANPSLSFTPDGRIIGYRAVNTDFGSKHRGYGIVNGKEIENGSLDNSPGNVLEFPRYMVDQNPSQYCSIGLHVGTWEYAYNYGCQGVDSRFISVAFAAHDVVSPPQDAYQKKIRVSKYTVMEEISQPYTETIVK